MTWLRQLDAQLRALLPFATTLVAVLIDVAPLVGTGPAGLTSFATLCTVYFWSLYRPDLFTPAAAFVIGLIYDALAGLPLGLSSLALLLVRSLMVVQQRFFLARSFPVIWCCFLLLAPAVEAGRWLLDLAVVGASVRAPPGAARAAADDRALPRRELAARAHPQPDPAADPCIVRATACAPSRAARCCSAPASSGCSGSSPAGSTTCRW